MPRGQVNLLSCAKIVASLSYYQQGKGLGDALMHLIPPPTHLAYYQQGKGAADALMHIVLQPPPHMWTRLTSYLRWLILLRTRRDKGRGSSTPPSYAYVDASVFKHLSSKQHKHSNLLLLTFCPPPLRGQGREDLDMHSDVEISTEIIFN